MVSIHDSLIQKMFFIIINSLGHWRDKSSNVSLNFKSIYNWESIFSKYAFINAKLCVLWKTILSALINIQKGEVHLGLQSPRPKVPWEEILISQLKERTDMIEYWCPRHLPAVVLSKVQGAKQSRGTDTSYIWKNKDLVLFFLFCFLVGFFKVFQLQVRNIWAQGQRRQVWVAEEGENLSPCSGKPEKDWLIAFQVDHPSHQSECLEPDSWDSHAPSSSFFFRIL